MKDSPSSTESDVQYAEVTSFEAFRALEPEWNALLQRSGANTIYLTYEYLSTWWEVYGVGHRLWILIARDPEQKLIGIAPLTVGPGSGPRQLVLELRIMGGQCESTSEALDFIVELGWEREISLHFMGIIRSGEGPKWNLLTLPIVQESSTTMQAARACLANWGAPRTREREAPYCVFPDTWEKYLQTRSAKFRSTIRHRTKKLQRLHHVELKVGGRDVALDVALLQVVRLHASRWGSDGEAFHTLKFLEFHRRLLPKLAARGWVALLVLMVDGRAAAGRYDFLYGGKIWGFQGGWDASYAKLSIGMVMNALTFQWAIETHGVTEYDFGVGTCRYKAEWADGSRCLLDVCMAHPQSFSARMLLAAWDWKQTRRMGAAASAESHGSDFALSRNLF